MKKRLPKTIKMETRSGDREIPLLELGATETPSNPSPKWDDRLSRGGDWDGHTKAKAPGFLLSWKFPERVKAVRDKVSKALEDGIPDQRRSIRWNELDGILDDRFVSEIAQGEEVERPFWRWQKGKHDTVRVAICLDSTCYWAESPEVVMSRMIVAAGLASALESLDYEVSVLGGQLMAGKDSTSPRQSSKASAMVSVLKGEDEPLVESGFAHFADTGLRRLMVVWAQDANGRLSHLSDREWRELSGQADLYIYCGPAPSQQINAEGFPGSSSNLGPAGPGVLRLELDRLSDIDDAIEEIETFFKENA